MKLAFVVSCAFTVALAGLSIFMMDGFSMAIIARLLVWMGTPLLTGFLLGRITSK